MKKIKLYLAAVLIAGLSFTSCSDDDNNGPSTGGEIMAKWSPIKTVTKLGSIEGEIEYINSEPTCGDDYIEFATGGVFNRGVWDKNTDTLACEIDMATATTYTKSNNDLTIGAGLYQGTYKITLLTGSELRFESSANSPAGTTITTFYFEKQ